jgi:acyl-CoA reductase-like NAD-dependent aldehyde dehydrogenase
MGQNCCSASRTFVQEGIYDKFVEKATKLASNKKIGDQFDPDTQVWPLVSLKRFINFFCCVLHKINILHNVYKIIFQLCV